MNNFARPGLGATELPPVNSDDNGKVLGVSDGAWAKVAASGGSDLPDDPAQDGTYNLQNTVSSGTSTLSWASGSSGGGVLVVNVDDDTGVLNKTWQEIRDAMAAGQPPVIGTVDGSDSGILVVGYASIRNDSYGLWLLGADIASDAPLFVATSANDYPVIQE